VTTNRPFRVRFNCPVNGAYRRTELIGTPGKPAAEDTAANRCSAAAYPYPSADLNPLTRPNHDGPIRELASSVEFGAVQTIEFWPDGTAHIDDGGVDEWPAIDGAGVAITLKKGAVVKTVTVNGLGKIQKQ
jgi:hypothetical protein